MILINLKKVKLPNKIKSLLDLSTYLLNSVVKITL